MNLGYARAGTHDPDSGRQLEALERVCARVFQEKTTARLTERPELLSCLAALRKGDTLVVWKLDRLARSLKELVRIVQELNRRDVGFRSLSEAIDTTCSGGLVVFHLFGALAEFEHSVIRERTLNGLQAARARGRKGGRRPSLTHRDIRRALEMLRDPTMTKTEVARHFGVSRVTLNASLARMPETASENETNA
jgi:DNA invertase Pin-like site-specific DNA recombinase